MCVWVDGWMDGLMVGIVVVHILPPSISYLPLLFTYCFVSNLIRYKCLSLFFCFFFRLIQIDPTMMMMMTKWWFDSISSYDVHHYHLFCIKVINLFSLFFSSLRSLSGCVRLSMYVSIILDVMYQINEWMNRWTWLQHFVCSLFNLILIL